MARLVVDLDSIRWWILAIYVGALKRAEIPVENTSAVGLVVQFRTFLPSTENVHAYTCTNPREICG